MEVRLDGAVALVTGGSRGIGRAVVHELLAAGARGVVVTARHAGDLESLVEDHGSSVVAVAGDVTDDAHADAAVRAAVDRFGSCDLLVNNAGANPRADGLADIPMSAVDRTWAVNLRAPLVFSRAAWAGSMAHRGGAIVTIGSIAGLQPMGSIGAYGVAKAGVHFLTRQLASELAPRVRVNAVSVGVVRTGFSELLWSHDERAVAASYPLGRLGEPEDVARTVCFLLSDAADWITGAVLPVDGGITTCGIAGETAR